MNNDIMDNLVSLAKRRGFIYPSSDIYGGIAGFWDYGPVGVELKNNLKKLWWQNMVYDREDVVGLDAAIVMNPLVWQASGHLKAFTDPLVECKICHERFRQDSKDKIAKHEAKHQGKTSWTEGKTFNLLTEVLLGATEPKQTAYLRGEITQGVFVNFQNIVSSNRVQIPFGIAQIGKAFRNEVTPGNFTFRSREFEQMELEYFIAPDEKEAEKIFNYWKKERMDWYLDLGIDKNKLRFRDHQKDEISHYAKYATDIEYQAPFGWKEFEGIHHRGDWDLSRHKLTYKDKEGREYTPWVIETSGGVDRAVLFILLDALQVEEKRTWLQLDSRLAPYKAAVFPLLSNKPELKSIARKIYLNLKKDFTVYWDDRGNIGKRYYFQDEIGTPFCVTVDFDSLEKNDATLRFRDNLKQERVSISKIGQFIKEKIK